MPDPKKRKIKFIDASNGAHHFHGELLFKNKKGKWKKVCSLQELYKHLGLKHGKIQKDKKQKKS